jgi:hypothetical protein
MEAEVEYLGKETIDYHERIGPAAQTVHTASKGLCSTCSWYPDCIFCGSKSTPVQYCEEYTDIEPFSRSNAVGRETAAHAGDGIAIFEKDRFKGLCVNCSKNRSCLYAKLKGGVWHCEEYC